MKLTIAAFIQTLHAHRLLDHALPSLNLEKAYWAQFCFCQDASGAAHAHYINPELRNDMNLGSVRFELLKRVDPLMSWTPEGMHS